MTPSNPKTPIYFTTALLIALASAVMWFGLHHGVRHDSNFGTLALFSIVSWLAYAVGLATVIWSLFLSRQLSPSWRLAGVVMGAFLCSAPWLRSPALQHLATIAERRDFLQADPVQLRSATQQLMQESLHKDYALRWFGAEVPAAEVPLVIRQFIPGASYVTVDEHGLVLVTDGMGAWRGGYMILPPCSDFIPPKSRRIADGFFYVTSDEG